MLGSCKALSHTPTHTHTHATTAAGIETDTFQWKTGGEGDDRG